MSRTPAPRQPVTRTVGAQSGRFLLGIVLMALVMLLAVWISTRVSAPLAIGRPDGAITQATLTMTGAPPVAVITTQSQVTSAPMTTPSATANAFALSKERLPFPTPVNAAKTSPVFAVPDPGARATSGGLAQCCSSLLTGLAVAADGTFWVAGQEADYYERKPRLHHFSVAGALLDTIELDGKVNYLGDVRTFGNELWVVDGDGDFFNVLKLAADGQVLARYEVYWPYDPLRLMFDERGHALADGWDGNRSPARVVYTDGLQVPERMEGYSWGGRLYKSWTEPAVREDPTYRHYFAVGDVEFELKAPTPSWRASVLHVLADGSFYAQVSQWGEAFDQTILHLSKDGKLIAGAPIPLIDLYDETMHRVAIGPGDEVYLLTQSREVRQLHFGPVVGFSITPGGPPEPTLGAMLADSLGVAEVDLVAGGAWSSSRAQKVIVRRWLTAPADDAGNVIGLLKSEDEHALLANGSGSYILFLQAATDTRCEAKDDFFTPTRSLRGIMELEGGRITATRLSAYEGKTVDELAREISALPPPNPYPTGTDKLQWQPPKFALADLAKLSDFIAEGEVTQVKEYGVEAAGGVQKRDWNLKVSKWHKKPLDWKGDSVPFVTHKGANGDVATCRFSMSKGPFILFLNKGAIGSYAGELCRSEFDVRGFSCITKFLAGIFAIEGTEIDFGGIRRFWGMPVGQFEQELRDALTQPTGTEKPLP